MWSDILKRRGYRLPKQPRLFIQLVDDLFKERNIPSNKNTYTDFLETLAQSIENGGLTLKRGKPLANVLVNREAFTEDVLQAIKVPVREFLAVSVDRENLSPVEIMQKLYPFVEGAADRFKEYMDSVVFSDEYLSEGEGIAEIKELAESIGARFIPNRRSMASPGRFRSGRGNRPTNEPVRRQISYYGGPTINNEIIYTDINDVIFNLSFDDKGVKQLILSKAKVGKLPRTTHDADVPAPDGMNEVIEVLSNIANNDHFKSLKALGDDARYRRRLLAIYIYTLNHVNATQYTMRNIRPDDMSPNMPPRQYVVNRIFDNYRNGIETTVQDIQSYTNDLILYKSQVNYKFRQLVDNPESEAEGELIVRRYFPGLFEPYFIPRRGRKAKRVSVKNINVISDGINMPTQVGDPSGVPRRLGQTVLENTTLSVSIANKLDELGIRNTSGIVRAVGNVYVQLYVSEYGTYKDEESVSLDVFGDALDYLQGGITLEDIREEYNNVTDEVAALLEDDKTLFESQT